jgi:YHS domain-containing protein
MIQKLQGILWACSLLLSVAQVAAQPPVNTNGTAHAVGGYDVVAYFTDGAAVHGSRDFAASYRGATWLFASADHKARFEKSPAAYLPAYLGYCAYGAAQQKLVRVDPEAFTIRKGKLYLNYSLDVRRKWLADPDGFIQRADQYFSTLDR